MRGVKVGSSSRAVGRNEEGKRKTDHHAKKMALDPALDVRYHHVVPVL